MPLQEEIREFYVDDPDALEEVRKKWVTHGYAESKELVGCGHDFEVTLYKDGKAIDKFSVLLPNKCTGLEDGSFIVKEGVFYRFNRELIKGFFAKYKKPRTEEKEFSSVDEGRKFLKKLGNDESIIFIPKPKWKNYEGRFKLSMFCDIWKNGNLVFSSARACMAEARKKIQKAYPSEKIELSVGGYSTEVRNVLYIDVISSKSFYNTFDVYYVDKDNYFTKWSPFRAYTIIYRKEG